MRKTPAHARSSRSGPAAGRARGNPTPVPNRAPGCATPRCSSGETYPSPKRSNRCLHGTDGLCAKPSFQARSHDDVSARDEYRPRSSRLFGTPSPPADLIRRYSHRWAPRPRADPVRIGGQSAAWESSIARANRHDARELRRSGPSAAKRRAGREDGAGPTSAEARSRIASCRRPSGTHRGVSQQKLRTAMDRPDPRTRGTTTRSAVAPRPPSPR